LGGIKLLFNSYTFIFIFLPVTFFLYFYLNRIRLTEASKGILVVSSLLFYSWWNIDYLPLILLSIIFNYAIGSSLARQRVKTGISRRMLLLVGVTGNLGLLGYYKYFDFFLTNINYILGANFQLFHLILPLAISFFTFQQIAYLVDSYRGETKEYDFLNYTIFVTFFPQLIAGPIVHHKEMMPQFANARNKVINYQNIGRGLFIFSFGLFKKVVIADTFAPWANAGFDLSTSLTFFEAWATSLSYTFQLYFDFSGYTDMAIGAALLFNIKLPLNFWSPYKSGNIQDFWRRWHITLSRFLRDYIYIPLGGNRKGEARTFLNLMITFILGGIWHGAGWTFIFWGFMHGAALVTHRLWQKTGLKLNAVIAWFLTFNFVNIAWIFFRAKEWSDASKVLKGMLGYNGIVITDKLQGKLGFLSDYGVQFNSAWLCGLNGNNFTPIWLIVIFIVAVFFKNSNQYLEKFRPTYIHLIFIIILFWFALTNMVTVNTDFLYFNF